MWWRHGKSKKNIKGSSPNLQRNAEQLVSAITNCLSKRRQPRAKGNDTPITQNVKLSPSLFLHHLHPLTHRRPAIMLVIPPTPLLTIPPRRRLLPLPLQPPHQFPQEPLIPAIRMSLNERVRLLPSPDHEHNPSPPPPPATTKTKTKTSSRKGLPLTKRTNQPPTPSTPPSPPPPPTATSYRPASARYSSRPPSTQSRRRCYSSAP